MIRSAENFSIIAGTAVCNAHCPFCVSKMTGLGELGFKPQEINWRNFKKAAQLAKDYQVGSVLITGKGEPTLFPDQISQYLANLQPYNFPLIDLQTNGVLFEKQKDRMDEYLKVWYEMGLAFVAFSIVSQLAQENAKIYTPHSKNGYVDLDKNIDHLHQLGFSVRLSLTMFESGVDSPEKVAGVVDYAKKMKVEQLTLRRVAKASVSENAPVEAWTREHLLREEQWSEIKQYLETSGQMLLRAGHGAMVYDVGGQNVCLTNALTTEEDPTKIRQIIFYPNGRVRFDWQFAGATLL